MTVATEKRVYIGDLHFELNLWLNEFKFYKDEIRIFNNRLEEIVVKNTSPEVLQELEHFQNQYIRQEEVIDVLRHDVKQHENLLETESNEHPVAIDHRFFEDHTDLRNQIERFKDIYAELKIDFFRFLSKWM